MTPTAISLKLATARQKRNAHRNGRNLVAFVVVAGEAWRKAPCEYALLELFEIDLAGWIEPPWLEEFVWRGLAHLCQLLAHLHGLSGTGVQLGHALLLFNT